MIPALIALSIALPSVTVVDTPRSGIQPQAASDGSGVIHLLEYTGPPQGGNLDYLQSKDGGKSWTAAARVNSKPGSAMAMGTIRGGQLAVSPSGSVFVVWLGTGDAEGVYFSKKLRSESSFSAQTDLHAGTAGMDGGASIAASDKTVDVVWHAAVSKGAGEDNRKLWLRHSTDLGNSFQPKLVLDEGRGACGCCSVKAAASADGKLEVLFRSAFQLWDRDTYSIEWRAGQSPSRKLMDKWRLNQCPMSSFSILPEGKVTWAWETRGRVVVDGTVLPGESAKHPSLATDGNTILCAYVSGSGWERPGTLAYCLLDKGGKILESNLNAGRIPVWSLASAVFVPSRGYLVFR
jgi:hypothetical protein